MKGTSVKICNGIGLREALRLASKLDLPHRTVPGTDELMFAGHHCFVRHKATRKTASRALVRLLRIAERRQSPYHR
jgi:hypothetical protein